MLSKKPETIDCRDPEEENECYCELLVFGLGLDQVGDGISDGTDQPHLCQCLNHHEQTTEEEQCIPLHGSQSVVDRYLVWVANDKHEDSTDDRKPGRQQRPR